MRRESLVWPTNYVGNMSWEDLISLHCAYLCPITLESSLGRLPMMSFTFRQFLAHQKTASKATRDPQPTSLSPQPTTKDKSVPDAGRVTCFVRSIETDYADWRASVGQTHIYDITRQIRSSQKPPLNWLYTIAPDSFIFLIRIGGVGQSQISSFLHNRKSGSGSTLVKIDSRWGHLLETRARPSHISSRKDKIT